ncbi:hypothetical protein ACWDKQ_18720 [Saccharopolyspora sp. NPDC000995]
MAELGETSDPKALVPGNTDSIHKTAWSMTIYGDLLHSVGIIGVSGHPWLTDGQYRRPILAFSNNDEASVKLDLQPTPAVI